MTSETAVRGVERLCYAGLDSVSLRRQAAERIARIVPFAAYAFSTCDPDTGLMSHTVGHGIPDGLSRAYVDHLYPTVNAPLAMEMARTRQAVYSMVDHSPEARAPFLASGLRSQLDVAVANGGRLFGIWCLMMGDASPALLRRGRVALQRLAPHIARGLRAAALMDQALAEGDAPTESTPGVLVLDAKGHPVVRTPAVAAWLADLADVGIEMPDGIPLGVRALASQLRVARAGVGADLSVRMHGRSGRWYVLSASLAEPDTLGDCSTVIVIRPAVPREVAALLMGLYDLSAREREVVAAVTRGESTKQIAAALGVSPHTVDEHIERACEKIGVRGRKALIARLYFDGYRRAG